MAINLNELKTWIETDEGKAWLEGQKTPLIAKRDELLAEIKAVNGRLSEQVQRTADSEKLLAEERAAVRTLAVDREIDRLLEIERVPETLRPGIRAELTTAYGVTVEANGPDRKAIAKIKDKDGTEKALSLRDAVRVWATSPAGKVVCLAPDSSGGGARGSGGNVTNWTREKIAGMKPAEVAAAFDDPSFQDALKNLKG